MSLASVVVVAAALFVSTNIDDLFVLAAFYADGRYRSRDVVIGQYVGMAALTLASFALALPALVVPPRWVGLLGILPLGLGLHLARSAFRSGRNDRDDGRDAPRRRRGGSAAITAVTIANGADNVAAYVPYFASRRPSEAIIVAGVFAILTGAWCLAAHGLVHHPTFGAPLRRYGARLLPCVLIALGILIFVEAGSYELLLGRFR